MYYRTYSDWLSEYNAFGAERKRRNNIAKFE